MLYVYLLVTLVGWLPFINGQVTPTERYPEEGTLSLATSSRASDVYVLFWKHDGVSITFEVHCRTLGYVGFGISPGGGMDEADIVIGWVREGNTYFKVRSPESAELTYKIQ